MCSLRIVSTPQGIGLLRHFVSEKTIGNLSRYTDFGKTSLVSEETKPQVLGTGFGGLKTQALTGLESRVRVRVH